MLVTDMFGRSATLLGDNGAQTESQGKLFLIEYSDGDKAWVRTRDIVFPLRKDVLGAVTVESLPWPCSECGAKVNQPCDSDCR